MKLVGKWRGFERGGKRRPDDENAVISVFIEL